MPPEISDEDLKAFNEAKAERDALKKEKSDAEAARLAKEADDKKKKETDDPELIEKARREREAGDKDANRIKRLESSIGFNMKSADFLKLNAALLPKEVEDILKAAEKENYSDATEKADALKAGIMQSFFSLQANVDLLTAGQKAQLDDYLKLTKTGKQERAQAMYDMVFEPAFEMLKRTKRAEQLNKGYAGGGDAEEAYKQRLMSGSNKHYGLEKK